jgi:hypothetical protein
MSEEYVERTLSDGTVVRCAPVPPLAIPEVVAAQSECKMPPMPMQSVKTKLDVVEEKPAGKDSPEYEAWRVEVGEVQRRRAEVERIAYFVLGVLSWKLPGRDKFTDRVPKGWKIPQRLTRVGIKPSESELGRAGDFIKYGLLKTTNDLSQIQSIIFGTKMLTESEVEAAADLFPGAENGAADTASTTEE